MKTKTTTPTILALVLVIVLISLTSIASGLTIKDAVNTPEQVAPGESVQVKLTIENEMDENFENVLVSLDLSEVPFAPYQSGSQKTIDNLDDGDEENIRFDLIALADAEAGTYKIPITISYNNTEETSYISLTINSEPELKLNAEGDLIKGMNKQLSIRITNTGLSQVKLLSISISNTIGIEVLNSKQVYIGNIDSDDFDSADFDVFISDGAPSLISLPVKLTYRDATNKLFSENINLVVKTYTQEEAIKLGLISKSNALTYVVVVIGLIILYLIYRNIKKRKKKKLRENNT